MLKWDDVGYPPYGSNYSDMQLPRHYQHKAQVSATCPVINGRASSVYQPLMITGDDRQAGILITLGMGHEFSGEVLVEDNVVIGNHYN